MQISFMDLLKEEFGAITDTANQKQNNISNTSDSYRVYLVHPRLFLFRIAFKIALVDRSYLRRCISRALARRYFSDSP